MQYISHYRSPLGDILLAADEIGLTGLWFEGQKYFARCLDKERSRLAGREDAQQIAGMRQRGFVLWKFHV